MKYVLSTERLKLRQFTFNDAAFIVELMNSPGWLKYIGDRHIRTEEQARFYLENGPMKSYRENGFGLYLVEIKFPQTPIGMCGILKRDTLEYPDIGFALHPDYANKGYAYEIANATLQYAQRTLKLSTIAAVVQPDNERSIRLLEKIGMKATGTTIIGNNGKQLVVFISS